MVSCFLVNGKLFLENGKPFLDKSLSQISCRFYNMLDEFLKQQLETSYQMLKHIAIS